MAIRASQWLARQSRFVGCEAIQAALPASRRMRMYRESFETMAAEITRLRDEIDRLHADAWVARQMTAPQRVLRVVGAAVVTAATVANLCAVAASSTSRHELSECSLRNRVLTGELSRYRGELEAETATSAALRQEVLRDHARAMTFGQEAARCGQELGWARLACPTLATFTQERDF